ncbi:hypothetical protein IQ25_01363 [Novosphingobium taihuense]|uniref:Uncharacterized protein n=1 Tax=Novosphingobium taihuense TaxID=260085 RepID=A0A7W7EUR1_9SPHN|nr:hypothetical protein [Novosphingobium taihuense]TWH87086.1 hypothetical protein IQ25_01363 [Novosphingobium taihuense]
MQVKVGHGQGNEPNRLIFTEHSNANDFAADIGITCQIAAAVSAKVSTFDTLELAFMNASRRRSGFQDSPCER